MADAFTLLGVATSAGPDEIRRRYLELVRQHPPDRDPRRFAEIRAAYDEVSNPVAQLRRLLFETDQSLTIDAILAQAQARFRNRRIATDVLLSLGTE